MAPLAFAFQQHESVPVEDSTHLETDVSQEIVDSASCDLFAGLRALINGIDQMTPESWKK